MWILFFIYWAAAAVVLGMSILLGPPPMTSIIWKCVFYYHDDDGCSQTNVVMYNSFHTKSDSELVIANHKADPSFKLKIGLLAQIELYRKFKSMYCISKHKIFTICFSSILLSSFKAKQHWSGLCFQRLKNKTNFYSILFYCQWKAVEFVHCLNVLNKLFYF